jgi:hypothetical protein
VTAPTDGYRDVAEAAWRWALAQVRYDDGPWIPTSVTDEPTTDGTSGPTSGPPWDRDGMHSGIGGIALTLAEIHRCRPWTDEETALADAIAERIRSSIRDQHDATFFDGLVSSIGTLTAVEAAGAETAVARLAELVTPDGWPQTALTGPRYRDGARINDLTLGTAGVLAGALWARRHGVPGAEELAGTAADVLLAEAEQVPSGLDWPFVPTRFVVDPPATRMPNLSHGLAGIAATLALAGAELTRPDLVDAATRGAAHLVSLAGTTDGGFVVARTIPPAPDMDEVTYTWCHGPTGTSLLFRALEYADVADVADESPAAWQRRCLRRVRTSGLPARLRPGFWDNDGRCCGTAGVGDAVLDSWHRSGIEEDLVFAIELADTLVERAVRDGDHACWRFLEHRNDDPLLPPGVGWMQGAAGIAAYLFHVSRVVEHGRDAEPAVRLDNWWAV